MAGSVLRHSTLVSCVCGALRSPSESFPYAADGGRRRCSSPLPQMHESNSLKTTPDKSRACMHLDHSEEETVIRKFGGVKMLRRCAWMHIWFFTNTTVKLRAPRQLLSTCLPAFPVCSEWSHSPITHCPRTLNACTFGTPIAVFLLCVNITT